MQTSRARILVVGFLTGLTGCKGPEGPTGAQLTGDLFGYVKLYDEHYRQLTDNHGVAVSVENASYSAASDSSGKWILKNVKAGVYNISFSKNAYGTVNVPSFQFVGGGNVLLGTKVMGQKPTSRVLSVSIDTTGGSSTQTLNFLGSLSGDTSYYRYVIVYSNSDSTVDSSNYVSIGEAYTTVGSSTFFGNFYLGDLRDHGIVKGMTVYLLWHTYNPVADLYVNPSDGKGTFSALSVTRLKTSFVMP